MATITKKQKVIVELMDDILTWDEENKKVLDPHLAEKLAKELVIKGYDKHRSRKERLITIDGKTKRMSDWCREYDVSTNQVYTRIQNGWSVDDAIKTPIGKRRGHKGRPIIQMDMDGKVIKVWAKIKDVVDAFGCSYNAILDCCGPRARLSSAYGYKWAYADKKKKTSPKQVGN